MLSAFTQAFRTPDLRAKLLFTLGIMALFRLGSILPAPGVNLANAKQCIAAAKDQNLLSLVNVFSGGALLQLSIFALGIMPYITASIILQLLTVVIPHLENLKQEGSTGQETITKYTRWVTIVLAVLQATSFTMLAVSGQLYSSCSQAVVYDRGIFSIVVMILTMTAGTSLIMWLGELITARGVGNGMSILIFTGICANFPGMLYGVVKSDGGWVRAVIVVTVFLAITAVVVFVEQCQRRVPVQYAKRVIGRRTIGGSTTYLPIKINMANVIPVIFASSILALPQMISSFGSQNSGWVQFINRHFLDHQSWSYFTFYALLIFGFTFFYVAITFDTDEVADNMKRYGGFIPGIRAGEPTVRYLSYVINRITTAGSIYLVVLALIPTLAVIWLDLAHHLPFGGTTILIMVGVGLQTVKEVNSQLQQRHYEGFLS